MRMLRIVHILIFASLAEPWRTTDPMTPFEKKYLASGHELWRCRVSLP